MKTVEGLGLLVMTGEDRVERGRSNLNGRLEGPSRDAPRIETRVLEEKRGVIQEP